MALMAIFGWAAGCSGGGASENVGGGPDALTYHRDAKPILDEKCNGCHTPGAIAPFALEHYDDVVAHKQEVKVAVQSRIMPPWPPGQGCAEYQHDRSLSDDQVSTLVDWIDQGAVEGDPADDHSSPVQPAGLSRVDGTVKMAVPYTPMQSPDDYRCFLVDWPSSAATHLTGLTVRPGNRAIVHHVIAYVAPAADVPQYQMLDDADPGPGYTCFGGPALGKARPEWLGAWAPGAAGGDFPAGTGILVQPGSKLIVQVHYNTASNLAAPDQTSIDLKLDGSVEKEAVLMPYTSLDWVLNKQMDIPAGNPDVVHSWDADASTLVALFSGGVFANGKPFTIYDAALHMHTHGTTTRVDLLRASGATECLLDIAKWDFHWQGQYELVQPKIYNPGDKLHLECHWDNSQGTTDLNWGEGTGDEMCLAAIYITQ
jgi:hypothetical protein